MFCQFMEGRISHRRLTCNRQSDAIFNHNCDMSTFASRLKERRKKKGLSQADLAKKSKVSQTTISDIERGRNDGSKSILDLARALGCRPEWLQNGELPEEDGEPGQQGKAGEQSTGYSVPKKSSSMLTESIPIIEWENPEDLPENVYALVPRVMVKLSAGNGYINYEEETGPPLAFQSSWIKREGLHRSSLCVVEAHGDSMEDRIHDGDILVVDTSKKQVVDGKVYALRYQNELRVKRLYRRYDGGLILHSDNKDKYPPENIPPEGFDHIEIIGRVVHLAGRV
jgi:phage repressor protein C with HTH and peptisase S24 domain